MHDDIVSKRDLLKKAYDILENARRSNGSAEYQAARARLAKSYILLADSLGSSTLRV
jgi:hypothetical protein